MHTASAVHENKLGISARNAAVCTTTSGTKYLSMTNVGRVELGRRSGEFDVSCVMGGPIGGRNVRAEKNNIPRSNKCSLSFRLFPNEFRTFLNLFRMPRSEIIPCSGTRMSATALANRVSQWWTKTIPREGHCAAMCGLRHIAPHLIVS